MTEKIPVVVIVGGLAAAKARRRVSIRRLDLSLIPRSRGYVFLPDPVNIERNPFRLPCHERPAPGG
jgi:hypothetical protein